MKAPLGKALAVSALLGMTVGIAACSSEAQESASQSASPTQTASVTPSATVSATPAQPSKAKNKDVQALEAQGIKLGKVINVFGGSYPSYEVTPDSELAKFSSSKHKGGKPEGWSSKDMAAAQLKTSNFMLNTVLNNQARTDFDKNSDLVFESVSADLAPERRAEFKENFGSNDTTFFDKGYFRRS